MKVFLVGFMGAGKSQIGLSLAKKLQILFFDLDREFERRQGCSVTDFFRIHGETEFRREESGLLREITAKHKSFVMATGGGAPCFQENMKWMNEAGITFYLNVSVPELVRRLKRDKLHRPLIANLTDDELADFVKKLFKQRVSYYQQSALELYPENFSPASLLVKLADMITES